MCKHQAMRRIDEMKGRKKEKEVEGKEEKKKALIQRDANQTIRVKINA